MNVRLFCLILPLCAAADAPIPVPTKTGVCHVSELVVSHTEVWVRFKKCDEPTLAGRKFKLPMSAVRVRAAAESTTQYQVARQHQMTAVDVTVRTILSNALIHRYPVHIQTSGEIVMVVGLEAQ